MSQRPDLSFQQKSLFQQGYRHYSPSELRQLAWGLRFTPGVCSLITAVALWYQLPYALFTVAFLGIYAFFFPAGHPMDLLYNKGVRHLFGAVALPENPLPRRMACLAAGVLNTVVASFFLAGWSVAAIVTGVPLLVLQAIVITTHFCTLSWMYELLMRALGLWERPASIEDARTFMAEGAVIVDVRSQNEHAAEPIEGAVNLPLENLDENVDAFRTIKGLLVCKSGARSTIAYEKLRKHGITDVMNLGPMHRVDEL